jgi:PadR family transcriptional regulator AphA
VKAARAYVAGEGPFQQRAAQNMLAGAFLTDFCALVARWAEWATVQVEQWSDDPNQAIADEAEMAEIAERADW